jgi:hypothetical protein
VSGYLERKFPDHHMYTAFYAIRASKDIEDKFMQNKTMLWGAVAVVIVLAVIGWGSGWFGDQAPKEAMTPATTTEQPATAAPPAADQGTTTTAPSATTDQGSTTAVPPAD